MQGTVSVGRTLLWRIGRRASGNHRYSQFRLCFAGCCSQGARITSPSFAIRTFLCRKAAPGPGLVCGPFGCWESWGWGPAAVGYENIRFREGTIVFDFTKQSTNRLAYRAIGQKPVHRDTFNQDEISEFVHHMLGKLKTTG